MREAAVRGARLGNIQSVNRRIGKGGEKKLELLRENAAEEGKARKRGKETKFRGYPTVIQNREGNDCLC